MKSVSGKGKGREILAIFFLLEKIQGTPRSLRWKNTKKAPFRQMIHKQIKTKDDDNKLRASRREGKRWVMFKKTIIN